MPKKKNVQFQQPLGVCQRLFYFIMNSIIGRSLKRVTPGVSRSRGLMTEVLIEEPGKAVDEEEMLLQHRVLKPSNEIVVEFGHNNNNGWDFAPLQMSNPLLEPQEKGISSSSGSNPFRKRENPLRGPQDLEIISSKGSVTYGKREIPLLERQDISGSSPKASTSFRARDKGPRKSASAKAIATEMEVKNKNKESERWLKLAVEAEQMPISPMHHLNNRPLLSVLPNINEKSDEFIRKTKEDMRRNYSIVDPKASH